MEISTLIINTTKKKELYDFTQEVDNFVRKSNLVSGQVTIFVKHTTCAVIISELESDLEKDFINYLEKEGPRGSFKHSHGDLIAHDPKHSRQSHTPSHILSSIIGPSVQIPVDKNQMQLGTWQRICLLELDGPRARQVVIQILS